MGYRYSITAWFIQCIVAYHIEQQLHDDTVTNNIELKFRILFLNGLLGITQQLFCLKLCKHYK